MQGTSVAVLGKIAAASAAGAHTDESAGSRTAVVSSNLNAAAAGSGSVIVAPVKADRRIRIVVSDPALLGSSAVILDPSGQAMQEWELKHVSNVDARNWPAGAYILRLVDGSSLPIDCR